jgi:hypothetical protein
MFKTLLFLLLTVMPLSACDKPPATGGKWAEVKPPPDCKVKQIASEEVKSVVVLCEDGRVFH